MRDDQFRRWMEQQGSRYNSSTVNTYLASLRAVERRWNVDLDREYQTDGLESLVSRIRNRREGLETGGPEYRELSADIAKLKAYGEFSGGTRYNPIEVRSTMNMMTPSNK